MTLIVLLYFMAGMVSLVSLIDDRFIKKIVEETPDHVTWDGQHPIYNSTVRLILITIPGLNVLLAFAYIKLMINDELNV